MKRTVLRVSSSEANVQEHHTRVNREIHLTQRSSQIWTKNLCVSTSNHAAHARCAVSPTIPPRERVFEG